MRIEILTLFPEIFSGFLNSSLIKKAIDKQLLAVTLTNFRQYADPPHYSVDDSPYGGGAGMVLKPEPLAKGIREAKSRLPAAKVILLSAAGIPFKQALAKEFSQDQDLILICGRYEGVDQRVIDLYVDYEISIGDYVLMGGEIPAMVLIEATTRLIKDVIGNSDSLTVESFVTEPLLEAPQYTKPAIFESRAVPEVLLSGNHAKISAWRAEQSQSITASRRPELKRGKNEP